MKDNKFKIIIASYNNENWVEYNIASIINQTYQNYEVLYVDDCSQDNTFQKVKDIIGDNDKFTIIRNETNLGGTYNHTRFFDSLENDEILVLIDGDDWLFDDEVLEKLNDFYIQKEVWMTYGKFYSWDGESATEAYPQNTPFDDFIHRHKYYRRDLWRSSHLRTYKGFLIKAIDKQDFVSQIDGKLFWHAADLALAFPCLEMCPKEKIGVLDFASYVYNASKTSQERTLKRETVDNSKYEIEIRNKKTYKEGISGEKRPQINVYYDYCELNTIPEKFTYCYRQEIGEYDMVLIADSDITNYINGKIKVKNNVPIVARLVEHSTYWKNEIHNLLLQNYNKFDYIFTHDKMLLEKLPNAKFMPAVDNIVFNKLPNPSGHVPFKSDPNNNDFELPRDIFQIYPKTKLVSVMASDKTFLPGHVKRLEFLQKIKNKVDVYGTCQKVLFGNETRKENKFLSLRDYAFSIAIENLSHEIDDYYFSEKIADCFITGTVPIYYGCPNIGKFFDIGGILIFQNEQQLLNILDNLNIDLYYSMMDSIKRNFEISMKMNITNDLTYTNYYKDIINNFKK